MEEINPNTWAQTLEGFGRLPYFFQKPESVIILKKVND